jgi:hypothetical protein
VARIEKGWIVGDPKSDAGSRDVAIPPHIVADVAAHLAAEFVGPEDDALLFPCEIRRAPTTLNAVSPFLQGARYR